MKKIIALVMAAVLAVSVTACGGAASTAASGTQSAAAQTASASDKKILYHVYNTAPYVTLDPRIEYSNGIMILQNVYETLTHYNSETSEVEPMLATEWSSNEDGTQWTFKLRDDVDFHDGTHMTSASVKASVEKTVAMGQGAAFMWDSVESIDTPSDYEVVFNCSYAAPLDLISSGCYSTYIMSENAVENDSEWFNNGADAGSGPYTISQATGDTCVLTAYQEYRDGWKDDQYQYIVVQEVAESSARRQMLETGEAQLSSEFSSTDLDALEAETDKVYTYTAETFNNILLFFNSASEPCSNADFRRALAYAFPYDDTLNGVMNGRAAASAGLIPSGLWGHDDSLLNYYVTDLDKAQEYVDKSGIDVSGVTLTATYMNGYDEYASFLQLYQSNLKKLGITLELRSMEWDEQWDEAKATNADDRQDMFIMIWWPDYASPASWFDSLMHSESDIVYNLSYMNDSEIDKLIDDAALATATDRDTAEANYIEVQKKVLEEAYMLSLYDQSHTYVVSNSIKGVYENPAYSTAINYYNVTTVA